ncbi:MAG: hypothetical protein EON59_02615 [Alphaproteobacteria bacterium]|nr:MAG: hypothetical protein EON59_02615 [Alphaproteobacteria bacterium]
MAYFLEALEARHRRDEFCCGKSDIIDEFCRQDALSDHIANFTRVKVAVAPGDDRVLGFHALTAAILKESRLKYLLGLSHGEQIPAIRLQMFAAVTEHQGGDLGAVLMRDVFDTAASVAEQIGACCLCLDAANDRLATYYGGFDFQRISSKGLAMYIPISTVRDALAA